MFYQPLLEIFMPVGYIRERLSPQTNMNLYLINGFLGSGKTTAIANACKYLLRQNVCVAVVTNDQGAQQVDTAFLQSLQLKVGEVTNGCFCCRYNELEQTIDKLTNEAYPEIIFAESVGSCTDLVATVAKPFALHHCDINVVITVFADAYLLYSIMKGTSDFIHTSVQYIYKKQLEEADVIVINKTDLLKEDELMFVKNIVEEEYANKILLYQNSYNEDDVFKWLNTLKKYDHNPYRNSLNIDYNIYAEGEAALAWLDMKVSLHSAKANAAQVAIQLMGKIYNEIVRANFTIGHLKFLLECNKQHYKISYTTSGAKEDIETKSFPHVKHLGLLINARVQTMPEQLKSIIMSAIEEVMQHTGCRIVIHESSAFKPGYPKPLHRLSD